MGVQGVMGGPEVVSRGWTMVEWGLGVVEVRYRGGEVGSRG